MNFYQLWNGELWGNRLLGILALLGVIIFIGLLGRWSWHLMTSIVVLFIITFGTGFIGILWWMPMFLASIVYFVYSIYKFIWRD